MKQLKHSLVSLALAISLFFTGGIKLNAETKEISDEYTLKEVVVLSRHNIRAPLSSGGSVLAIATPHEWIDWSAQASELTLRGGTQETMMGQYFRKWLESENFFPENYVPKDGEVRFYANSLQRTIATAQYFSSGFLPVANVEIEHHYDVNDKDATFLPLLTFMNDEYAKDARKEMEKRLVDLDKEYETLMDILDYKDSEGFKNGDLKDLTEEETTINLVEGDEPTLSGALKTANALADALVLQYYEVKDPKDAGFGKELTDEQLKDLARIKEVYDEVLFRVPIITKNTAHPMLQEIDKELNTPGRKFTFLCGHDSTIASVLSSLGVKDYTLPNTVETKTSIGTKVVFEKYENKQGKQFARVRLVYQNTDQLKNVSLLDLENQPESYTIEFDSLTPNEDGLYAMEDFDKLLKDTINDYDKLMEQYGIEKPSIPNTAVK